MTVNKNRSGEADGLLRRAEEKAAQILKNLDPQTPGEAAGLLHELHVHQIALAMQSEEFRKAPPDGSPVRHAAIGGITGRRRSDEALFLQSKILATLAEGITLIRDDDDVIIFANAQFERMFGYVSGELIGKHVSVLNASGDQSPEEVANEIKNAADLAGAWSGEVHSVRKDGLTFWCHAKISSLVLPSFGKVWLSVREDITERKRVEAAVRESEARFRGVFDGVIDGILLTDLETKKFVMANRAICAMLGYAESELLTLGAQDIHREEDWPAILAGMERQIRREEPLSGGVRIKRRDGSEFYADISAVPVMLGGQRVLMGCFRDITERKIAEEKLRTSRVQLEEQNFLLEKKNVALMEMVDQIKQERVRIQNQILTNVDRLMMPLIARMKEKDGRINAAALDALEENLKSITSEFGEKLSRKVLTLTKREIEICGMIKTGLSSKEISVVLGISVRGVDAHRRNIRRKLNLSNNAVNLATYLDAM